MKTPDRRRPISGGWKLEQIHRDYVVWRKDLFVCLSSVVYIEDEHLPPHWEWLISFSLDGMAALNDQQINKCLQDFDALNFEEDNHERGIARKFWLAIDQKYRKPCPCKDEIIITEGDYKYSQKKD